MAERSPKARSPRKIMDILPEARGEDGVQPLAREVNAVARYRSGSPARPGSPRGVAGTHCDAPYLVGMLFTLKRALLGGKMKPMPAWATN